MSRSCGEVEATEGCCVLGIPSWYLEEGVRGIYADG
jgi:hypothetical protein